MKKAVIFDMDGVLVDTNHIHIDAWKEILKKYNIAYNDQTVAESLGRSRKDQLDLFLDDAGIVMNQSMKDQILKEKNNLALKSLSKLKKENVDDDVLYTILELKKRHIKMAVASSSKNACLVLEKTELANFFDIIVDGCMVENVKPAPDIFIRARDLLEEDGETCIIIEDSVSGVNAALAAGIDVCAFGSAYLCSNATYSIERISEILKLL